MERQIVLWHSKLGTDPSGGPGLSGPKKKNGPPPKSWIIDLVHINLKKKNANPKKCKPSSPNGKMNEKKKGKEKLRGETERKRRERPIE